MPLVKAQAWSDPAQRLTDPACLIRVLRDPGFAVGDLSEHLAALSQGGAPSYPELAAMARHTFAFQDGDRHLAYRRATKELFSARRAEAWRPVMDQAIDNGLARLGRADAPDLMRDFCEESVLFFLRRFIGCMAGEDEDVLARVRKANDTTRPMLSLRALGEIDEAIGFLRGCLTETGDAPDPEPMMTFMARSGASLDEAACAYVAVSVLIGGHTLAQSLAVALAGLLSGGLEHWQAMATPGWAEAELDRIISLYPSTLSLVRVAIQDAKVGACPFQSGNAAVLDVVAANATLRSQNGGHLSFSTGRHKCPGAAVSRLFLARALPAIARAFPKMALHRDGVRRHVTPLVHYPTFLPVTRDDRSARISARMIEIRRMAEARDIVNDAQAWSPPVLEPHLRVLAQRSGRDLETAICVARNAMFFMSGERHAALRRAISAGLGGNRLAPWQPLIDAEVAAALDGLAKAERPDLIRDFADPLFRRVAGQILGVAARDSASFDRQAPGLQDLLEPWLPLRELERLQALVETLLENQRRPDPAGLPGIPLYHLLLDADLPETDETDIKALVLVLYGASFNLSHTLGNMLHHLLHLPPEGRGDPADPAWARDELEGLIAICASPKYIYRLARKPVRLNEIEVTPGETARFRLLSINRGAATGHLAFGHGLHRCVGAALSKRVLRSAVPAIFARFPNLALIRGAHRFEDMSQTVALSALPCRLGDTLKES